MARLLAYPDTSSWRSFAVSSAVSFLLHTSLFFGLMTVFRGCQQASPGQAGGEVFREVGLFIVDGTPEGASDTGTAAGAGSDAATRDADPAATPETTTEAAPVEQPRASDVVPSEVPDVGQLLTSDASETGSSEQSSIPDLIGPSMQRPGGGAPGSAGGGSLIQPSEAGGARKTGGTGGEGETTFMNIVGVGQSFVYLIDSSSSMDGPRLRLARSQLKASLRLLQPNQQFAIIFYNEYCERLKLRRQGDLPMYFATDVNKRLAMELIDAVTPSHGTDHRQALLEALALRPDVLYFLTDGDEPELFADDLRDVKHEAGKTTIHVIRFGDGTLTTRSESWLQKLARQNGGEFREMEAARR